MVVVSYNLLSAAEQDPTGPGAFRDFQMIIVDECHQLRGQSSKRAQAVVPLAKRAKHALLLTGTPLVARAEDAYPLLEALLPEEELPPPSDFAARYGRRGARRLQELHALLGSVMLRRTKADMLPQLPKKRRRRVVLDLEARAGSMAAAAHEEAVEKACERLATTKKAAVAEYLSCLVAANVRFLVFAHHLAMLDALETSLQEQSTRYFRIDGSTPMAERSKYVESFQSSEEFQVALLSLTACSQGFTLSAASLVVFAERPMFAELRGFIAGAVLVNCGVFNPRGQPLLAFGEFGDRRGGGGGEGSSPAKRKAAEVVEVEDAISLGALKAELKAHQEAMKQDFQHAIGGVQKDMAERVTTVESEVTKQLQTTLALLKQLTDKQDNQGAKMAEVVEGQRYLEDKMEANQRSLEERIEKLETSGCNPGQSITSMATTDDGIGGRKPALIMGGWGDNTPANEVIEKATQILRQLKVDIDYQDTFVPGIRRGFALIPLKGARVGEGSEEYRQRIQRAITIVRNAKIQTGHVREDTGQPRYAYLTISQPPERRRRARLAAKVKRCILELGGSHNDSEVEFATGTVWYGGARISSAVSPAKEGADKIGPGWVDVNEMAKALRVTVERTQQPWSGLRGALQ
ncbi:ZRANB3 [Symbiodinium natans]|uniref:ZRANB3 protein n=1 Tax=Symbiodinium natans TaxID=878477 RepID=A0A812I3W1_9DINO|nr:ZRANB3 [Symbiodinium natans]